MLPDLTSTHHLQKQKTTLFMGDDSGNTSGLHHTHSLKHSRTGPLLSPDFRRPRARWPTPCSQPATTVTCCGNSTRRSRKPRPSCRGQCPRPTARWPSGGPSMRRTPSSARRSWKRPSVYCELQKRKMTGFPAEQLPERSVMMIITQ